MKLTSLEKILIQRDNISREEAQDILADARKEVADGANPEEVLYELGLEPDYIFDLI